VARADVRIDTAPPSEGDKPFGPVAAVFLAAGIGVVILGVLTTLAEASEGIKSALEWSKAVGPLAGKTSISVVVFLLSWGILYGALRDKDLDPRKVFMWTAGLVALGVVLTFPTFFQLFVPEE
jgi:hypothetical protein